MSLKALQDLEKKIRPLEMSSSSFEQTQTGSNFIIGTAIGRIIRFQILLRFRRPEYFDSAKMLQPGMPAPEIKAQAFLPNGTFKEVSLGDYKVIRGPLLS